MKKLLVIFLLAAASNAVAQSGDFYDGLLVTEDMKAEEQALEAKAKEQAERQAAKLRAGSILGSKPKVLKIDSPQIKAATTAQSNVVQKNYGEAPFGLAWGVSAKDVRLHGIMLRAQNATGYPNSYEASALPAAVKELPRVLLSFGNEDKLWRIIAYSEPVFDDEQASKGLFLFRKYFQLLKLKYGNAEEIFKPAIKISEQTIIDEQGNTVVKTIETESTIGDKTFLSDLKDEKASLYAKFMNNKIGASLTLRVDETGKSYIIIEYRNSDIMQENYDETMKAL